MEWRTSCAALCAAAMCEKPTPQIMKTPRKAAMLAAIRVFDRLVLIVAVLVRVWVAVVIESLLSGTTSPSRG